MADDGVKGGLVVCIGEANEEEASDRLVVAEGEVRDFDKASTSGGLAFGKVEGKVSEGIGARDAFAEMYSKGSDDEGLTSGAMEFPSKSGKRGDSPSENAETVDVEDDEDAKRTSLDLPPFKGTSESNVGEDGLSSEIASFSLRELITGLPFELAVDL